MRRQPMRGVKLTRTRRQECERENWKSMLGRRCELARAGRSGTRVTRCKYRPGAPCILGRGDRCRTAFSAVPWRHGAQTGGHPDGVSPLIAVSIVPAVDIRDRVTERLGASMAGGKTPARNYPKIGYRHGWCCCGRRSGSGRDRRGQVANRGFSVAAEAILLGRELPLAPGNPTNAGARKR